MGEPKRWLIEVPANGLGGSVIGPDETRSDAYSYVPVREDRVTEADIEAVARFLVPGGGWERTSDAAKAAYRGRASRLLHLVFDGEASRV